MQKIKDGEKKKLEGKDWQEYASTCTMRLNSQVQQYGGITPCRKVFGRSRKLPIATVGNPYFKYFTLRNEAPVTQTQYF